MSITGEFYLAAIAGGVFAIAFGVSRLADAHVETARALTRIATAAEDSKPGATPDASAKWDRAA